MEVSGQGHQETSLDHFPARGQLFHQNPKLLKEYSYPEDCPWPVYGGPSVSVTNVKHGHSGDWSTDTCADTSVSMHHADAGKPATEGPHEDIPSTDDAETHLREDAS